MSILWYTHIKVNVRQSSCNGHTRFMNTLCMINTTYRYAQNIFIFYSFQKLNLLYKILYIKNVDLIVCSYKGHTYVR